MKPLEMLCMALVALAVIPNEPDLCGVRTAPVEALFYVSHLGLGHLHMLGLDQQKISSLVRALIAVRLDSGPHGPGKEVAVDPYPDYGGTVYVESEGGLVRVLRADERVMISLDLIVNAPPGAISVDQGLLVLGNDPEGQVGYRLVAYDPTSRMFAAQLVHGIKGQPRVGVSGQRPDVVVTEQEFRNGGPLVTGEGSVTK